jgi:hypothetical protein
LNTWLILILITDLILFVALLLILYLIFVKVTAITREINQKTADLRALVASSEKMADDFYARGEETMKRLAQVLQGLAEQEALPAGQLPQKTPNDEAIVKHSNASPYDEVINLLKQGTPEDKIRSQSSLSEPEISLIIELFRHKELSSSKQTGKT